MERELLTSEQIEEVKEIFDNLADSNLLTSEDYAYIKVLETRKTEVRPDYSKLGDKTFEEYER